MYELLGGADAAWDGRVSSHRLGVEHCVGMCHGGTSRYGVLISCVSVIILSIVWEPAM